MFKQHVGVPHGCVQVVGVDTPLKEAACVSNMQVSEPGTSLWVWQSMGAGHEPSRAMGGKESRRHSR